MIRRSDFPEDFQWGVSSAAFQTEGAFQTDGKGLSIWDVFSRRRGKIKSGELANHAVDFYHRYPEDLDLVQYLKIPNFRCSISWPRVLPKGYGQVNQAGIDFYDRVIDHCLALGISPWLTLYHWDLPQKLQQKGGWTNRAIVDWFSDYVAVCAERFGDRVSNWMVMNEPLTFTACGYFLGIHAPGKHSLSGFLAAAHHAALSVAAGGAMLRDRLPSNANIGTTYSATVVAPASQDQRDIAAAGRIDTLLNRLFIEPVLGMGYPIQDLPILKRIERYMKPGDLERLAFDFDFIGMQTYTRETIRHSATIPYIWARNVSPAKRGLPATAMNWEIYPEGIYEVIKRFNAYPNFPDLMITENGCAISGDLPVQIYDKQRIAYHEQYLAEVHRAIHEGYPCKGYFVWTLTDNFEWAEGYHPKFGLIYVNPKTSKRIIKSSGLWYRNFLRCCP